MSLFLLRVLVFRKSIVFLHLLRSLARLLVSCLMISAPYISLKRKNQLYSDLPSFIKTETIWIFDDLYNGDILTCKSKKIDDRTCNYLQSIKKDNQEIYLINKQRDKTTVPPKKLISSFREINNEITKF